MCMCVCIYMSLCVCVCIYIYIYIYIYSSFIYLLMSTGYLGCLYILVIVDYAAIKMTGI